MGNNVNDGFYEIKQESDGVYVEVFEAKDDGSNVSIDAVEAELKRLVITEYDVATLMAAMVDGFDSVKVKVSDVVTGSYSTSEESVRVEISNDKMTAYATFYPTESPFKIDDVTRLLNARGVRNGVDTDMLAALEVEREFNQPYIVATGKPAIDGEQAVVEYMFKTEKDTKPEMDDEGNVNYHRLNIIANVKKGQLLARLKPATTGEEGLDLYGDVIAPRKPKPVKLRFGKNIDTNEDKTELFAACDGLVKLFEGKVVVNNSFEVPNNVGNSTGDIDFEGSIIVHGNVLTGFKVRAKGDVEVLGAVEGAEIISGGNIILHKGIQGMGKAHVEAAGFIQCRYIENANVVAGENVHSEAILHSTVTCKGSVTVEGKKGMISGGAVRAGESVKTKILGSHMGTVTTVEVGIDPIMLQEYSELRKDIPKMENEVLKLDQVIQLLNKRKEMAGSLEEDKQEMYTSAVRNKIFLTNKLTISRKKFEELQVMVDNKNNGFVDVTNEIYQGVKVSIGNISTYIREEMKYVHLEKKGADIKMSSL